MKITMDEQETVVNFTRTDDYMQIYTSDTTMITKLRKLVESSENYSILEEHCDKDGEVIAYTFQAPKTLLSLRSKKITRTLTDDQKQDMARRLAAARLRRSQKG